MECSLNPFFLNSIIQPIKKKRFKTISIGFYFTIPPKGWNQPNALMIKQWLCSKYNPSVIQDRWRKESTLFYFFRKRQLIIFFWIKRRLIRLTCTTKYFFFFHIESIKSEKESFIDCSSVTPLKVNKS